MERASRILSAVHESVMTAFAPWQMTSWAARESILVNHSFRDALDRAKKISGLGPMTALSLWWATEI
jgi:hypothetical protein